MNAWTASQSQPFVAGSDETKKRYALGAVRTQIPVTISSWLLVLADRRNLWIWVETYTDRRLSLDLEVVKLFLNNMNMFRYQNLCQWRVGTMQFDQMTVSVVQIIGLLWRTYLNKKTSNTIIINTLKVHCYSWFAAYSVRYSTYRFEILFVQCSFLVLSVVLLVRIP